MVVQVTTYKLRGGQVTPRVSTCGAGGAPESFFMQTFGVDKVVTDIYDSKTDLLASSDMQGQKEGDVEDPTYIDTTYSRANYTARPLRTTDGELVFNATEEHVVEFVDEDVLG
jgi:hypothetical protein